MDMRSEIIADSVTRRSFIGGSDARIIMGSDEAALFRLWREKRGEIELEDLSGDLIVQLGLATEPLNRHWYERNTGQTIECIQHRLMHPVLRWMGVTLDGIIAGSKAVFEAKFMLPWSFSEEAAAQKHLAQLQHNMWVTNAREQHSRSSPAAANGSRSGSAPIPSTSICSSPRKRNSGAAWKAASPLSSSALSSPARALRPSALSTWAPRTPGRNSRRSSATPVARSSTTSAPRPSSRC